MSAPAITTNAIHEHTGAKYLARGRFYFRQGKVLMATGSPDGISGVVQGARGRNYSVVALLDGDQITDSICSCPMGYSCKHVAAVLFYTQVHAETMGFPVTLSSAEPVLSGGEDFPSAEALAEWAVTHQVGDLLTTPINELVSGRGVWMAQRSFPTVHHLLLAQAEMPENQWDRPSRLIVAQKLQARLLEVSGERQAARLYFEQAQEWRSQAPPEPELQSLWLWLLERPPTLPWASGLAEPLGGHKLTVRKDPPMLEVANREHCVSLQPESYVPGQQASALAVQVALDLITHPALGTHPARGRVLTQVRVQPWERTMSALDTLVEQLPAGAVADEQDRLPGWLVNVDHVRSMLAPVLCRPLKRGGGLRTWRNSLARCQTPLPQDREVKEILSQTDFQHGSDARARSANNRALLALEGHPRLVSDQGQLITVRRAQLLMVWVPTQDGGVRVEPTLWGRALSGGELSALVNRWGAELSPLLESKTGRCAVVQLPPVQLALLQTLRKRGAVFPAASRDALMQRFGTMSSLIPMELRGELRGEQVPGDARPLLRLSLAADGALDLQALSRPLEDVRAWPPGHGPAELSTIREGHRVYCVRELDKEPRRIEQALAPLDLPASEEFSWTLDEPDQGLSTVQTLRELDDAFHLEWARPQPIISRGATAEDLKVRGAKQRDWFGLTGSLEVEGQVVPLADLLDAVRNNRRFVRVGERGWVALTSTLRASLEATATLARDSKKGVELPPMASAALLALEEAGATVELPRSLRVQQKRLREAATLRTQVPENLNAELRPYQREGFEWLARLAHWAPGAVLADDMGLGKTVQALALLLRRAEDGSALVVAPASVGINWLREAQRFAPSLRVRSYRGPDRGSLLDDLNPGDVLVTSWELMTRDAVALKEAGFHTAVLDEAQAIKNASTRRSRASADLGAAFTLALTGTPVENRVGELWSLMRTVVPGLLGSAQRFRERVVLPIERDGAQQPRRALSQLLRPFLLRRVKSQVAQDLPPRTDSIVRVELSPAERALYDTFRVSTIAELQGGAESSKGGAKRFRILAALTRLRQLACHPALVFPDDPTRSTKLDRLVETLVDLKAEGHRALVFSQFTTLLGFARQALEQVGLEVRYLDGSTSLKKRQAQVDAFQAGGGDAFLISLKAGGTGLNLTAASYVFHLDPWWNPSVEDQATDRAHRIGQTQPVTVIRLVAADTIEEVVLAMHAEKRALVSDLLEGTGKAAAMSTTELMRGLEAGEQVSLEAGEPVPAKAKKPPVEVAAPPAAVKAAPTEPGDLLTRYQALLDQEIALGTLRSMPTVRNYYRAVRNLLAWTQTQAGSITDLESVELWTSRYLKALRAGELTSGKSDLYFHGPSFSRLRRLVASESV